MKVERCAAEVFEHGRFFGRQRFTLLLLAADLYQAAGVGVPPVGHRIVAALRVEYGHDAVHVPLHGPDFTPIQNLEGRALAPLEIRASRANPVDLFLPVCAQKPRIGVKCLAGLQHPSWIEADLQGGGIHFAQTAKSGVKDRVLHADEPAADLIPQKQVDGVVVPGSRSMEMNVRKSTGLIGMWVTRRPRGRDRPVEHVHAKECDIFISAVGDGHELPHCISVSASVAIGHSYRQTLSLKLESRRLAPVVH